MIDPFKQVLILDFCIVTRDRSSGDISGITDIYVYVVAMPTYYLIIKTGQIELILPVDAFAHN